MTYLLSWAHAVTAHTQRSGDTSVDLVLSIHFYVDSRDQIKVAQLLRQAPFTLWAFVKASLYIFIVINQGHDQLS